MRIIRRGIILILAALLFSLPGCGDNKPAVDNSEKENEAAYQDNGVIIEHLKTPLTTIDPAYVQNAGEIMTVKLIFQGLVKENKSGEVVPCLANDWEISPDGLTYTFHLNRGVLFHNGKEIKASDFKFSWERVLRLNAPSAYLFAGIEGADLVLSGQETLASGITTVGDYILQVKLVRPQNNFLNLLTHPAGVVLDRYEVVEQGLNFAKPGSLFQPAYIPSGSGPFMLIEWIEGRSLTLGRNPSYYREKPAAWRVEFTLAESTEDAILDFLAGKIQILQDATQRELSHYSGEELNISLIEKPLLQFQYLGMNGAIKPFDNKAVRDAVMYSLNQEEILQTARGKSGDTVIGYMTDYWYQGSVQEQAYYTYNKERAVNMLALAGYPGGQNLPEIFLYCGTSEEDRIVADRVAENLSAVGFNIRVQNLSQKDLRRGVKNGEVPIYIAKFTARSNELDDFFREQIDSRWQKTIVNPLWDELLERAVQQEDTMRLNSYRQLEREVINDSRIRYLFTYKSAAAVSERLENFQLGPGNNVLFEEILIKE